MTVDLAYRCELLGGFRLFDPEGVEIRIPVTKGCAIIAYLLLSKQMSVSRAIFAGLLWSEKSEAAARTAQRQCVHQMKNRTKPAPLDFIEFTQDAIKLSGTSISTDLDEIAHDVTKWEDRGQVLDLDRLLYGLEDLDPAFYEWVWDERRRQRARLSDALVRQLEHAEPQDDRILIAKSLHQLDPSLEIAARPLIDHHIRTGNVGALLTVYKGLWDALEVTWGEEPSDELQKIVGQARSQLGESLPRQTNEPTLANLRRFVSVLVARVTTISESISAQSVNDLHTSFSRDAQSSAAGYGCTILPDAENEIVSVFGLPHAHEDDARNALEFALHLQHVFTECLRTIESEADEYKLAIGLDAGFINITDSSQGTAQIDLSDPLISAARGLTARSQGHRDIVATAAIGRRLGHFFELVPMTADEGEDPAFRVDGRVKASQATPYFNEMRGFVGRMPFLAALRTAWDEAHSQGIQIISLLGPAGLGKTKLAYEFLQQVTKDVGQIAAVRCNRHDRSAPLEPMYALLEHLSDEDQPEQRTPETLLQRLSGALDKGPAVIFIDDWHWADDASRSLLSEICNTMSDAPILLLLASREASQSDGLIRQSHQIQVPPLNAREVERRAEQLLRRPIDEELKSNLMEKSGGNPLFLEEICRALRAGPWEGLQHRSVMAFGADLHALIASWIDQLDEEDLRTVFAIAIHGDDVDLDLLASVLGYEVPTSRLQRLCTLDILRPDLSETRLHFKHGITRDVAYSMVPDTYRRWLHAKYLSVLRVRAEGTDARAIVEELAFHAQASGNLREAAEYAESAGDKALAASSLDQAERQYRKAMNVIEEAKFGSDWSSSWLKVTLKWARPAVYGASLEQMPDLERAQKIAIDFADQPRLCEILYWTGYNLIVRGEYDQAIEHLTRARDVATNQKMARLEFEATAILGYAHTMKAQYTDAEPMIEMAIGVKDKHPVARGKVPVTSVYSRTFLAIIQAEKGNFNSAEDLIQTALDRVAEFDHEIESSILTTGCTVLLWRGRWQKARDFARRARQRSERVSATYIIGTSRCLFSYSDWKITRNPANIAELQRASHWLDARGMRMFLSFIFGCLSDVLADAGRFAEAEIAARRALDWAEESGEGLGAAMACRTLARQVMANENGNWGVAKGHLDAGRRWAMRRGADHELAACAFVEAQLLIEAGEPDAARPVLDTAVSIFERLEMASFHQDALHLRDQLKPQLHAKTF